jgi:glycosyltransferase involved in cell wall biosynthesis
MQITGHHSEYISHLIDYLYIDGDDGQVYYFLLHPDFPNTFPAIVEKANKCSNIALFYVSKEDLEKCSGRGLIRDSLAHYRIMNRYVQKLSVQHVILLYFNTFQFALGLHKTNYTISGILFAQFYRLSVNSWKDRLRYVRKYLQTWLFVKNKRITKIFLLNDNKSVDYLNNRFHCDIFEMLPDPIPDIEPLKDFNIRKAYGIDSRKKIFLHIGSLNGRKGSLDILHSIPYIPEEVQKKICFLFAGKANSLFINQLMEVIRYYKQHSSVQLIFESQFIENARMKSFFDQCDCVLIPYKNAESSSGILGHAVIANKPVIGPNKGLLGELINQNNLGYTIIDIHELANKITKIVIEDKMFNRNSAFVTDRNITVFAKKIL